MSVAILISAVIFGRVSYASHGYCSHACGEDASLNCVNDTCAWCTTGNQACHFCCDPSVNCDPATSCCCGTPPPPPSPATYMDIGGYVSDASTGLGISNVPVDICNSIGDCTVEYTNYNGFFTNDTFVEESSNSYSVSVDNANLPMGFYGPATTTYQPNASNMTYTNRHSSCGGGDTPLGSTNGYVCQTWDLNNSCAQSQGGGASYRCNFSLISLGIPSALSVASSCIVSGSDIYNQGVFSWSKAIGAEMYILRIDYNDGVWNTSNSGNDWFITVSSNSPSCTSPTSCTVVLPINYLVKPFRAGAYATWTVEAIASGGGSSGQVSMSPPNFNAASCTPYSISGQLQEVSLTDANECLFVGNLNQNANTTSMTAQFTTTYGYNQAGSVNQSQSRYVVNNVPGDAGVVKVLPNAVPHRDTILANAGVSYDAACIQVGGVYAYQPNLAEISVGVHTNLINHNFGYVLNNPFDEGWFASLNGDVYGKFIEANVPPTVSGGLLPYLSSNRFGASAAVFGDNINVPDGRLVESGKYISRFSGDFWQSDFSFTPPSTAISISDVAEFDDPNIFYSGGVYVVPVNIANTFVQRSTPYNMSGGEGIAVVYVTSSDSTALNFTNSFTSASSDKRVLFIVQPEVTFSADIGANVSSITNLVDMRAHIEASIIASRTITFLSSYDGSNPATIDKVIILEGPLVAGSQDTQLVNIELRRNLGLHNALYPAVLVRYSSFYMTEITEDSGIMQTDIIWKVSP